MLAFTLNRSGCNFVEMADDGVIALEKIKDSIRLAQTYDVVFLDWSMPNLDGFDLLLSCRADPQLNNMAIVMLTSESEGENIAKAMSAGATAYITKPFKPEDISRQLDYIHSWRLARHTKEAGK
jgi:two-component system chemotaxis response regulator CheY